MSQTLGPSDGSIDHQQLVDYLNNIETLFSDFLQHDGGAFLLNAIKKLPSHPDIAIKELGGVFKTIVEPEPNLLDVFSGNWVGFLLWDDFNKKLHVLHRYHLKKREDWIDGARYDFISSFIESAEFRKSGFREPMSDLIFTDKSIRRQTLVFSWQKSLRLLNKVSNSEEKEEPFITEICFDKLGRCKWDKELDKLHVFVGDIVKQKNFNYEENFEKLAREISNLAGRIISDEDEEENLKKLFRKATGDIQRVFKSQEGQLIGPEELCRVLIWNRLFDTTWEHIYYIPAQFLDGSAAVSGIVCGLRNPLRRQEYVILRELVNRLFSFFHFGVHMQQIHRFALRTATAAIMARNKSHIHGSHIEHGLRNKMINFEDVIKDRLGDKREYYQRLCKQLRLIES